MAPLPESIRLGGPGPFVINLSAAALPIALPSKGSFRDSNAHVYQVHRVEDGRLRYRLRVGPFASEDDAETVLTKSRSEYPGALIARADAEDLRVLAKNPHAGKTTAPAAEDKPAANALIKERAIAVRPTATEESPAKEPIVKREATVPPAAPASVNRTAVAVPAAEPPPLLSLLDDSGAIPALIAKSAPQGADAPVKGASRLPPGALPTLKIPHEPKSAAPASTPQRPVSPPTKASMPPAASRAAPGGRPESRTPPQPQPIKLPASNTPAGRTTPAAESVPTTRTVRALTTLELEDDKASRWFVIQLALAGEAFEPEAVPNLDIFGAYRLYSVAGIDQGRIVHALRLGFFTDETSARAVASYLESFYDKPIIRRVSFAEHQRFAEDSMAPSKDVGATGKQAVIEITNERFVRAARAGQSSK